MLDKEIVLKNLQVKYSLNACRIREPEKIKTRNYDRSNNEHGVLLDLISELKTNIDKFKDSLSFSFL